MAERHSNDKETVRRELLHENHKRRELLRENHKGENNKYVYTQAAKITALFGSGLVATHFLLMRKWQFYHRLRAPYKVFGVSLLITGVFFGAADRAAVQADQQFAQQFSSVDVAELDRILEARKNKKFNWTREEIVESMKQNRYKLVGALWGTAMVGTLWYNWRRGDITTAQKLINARMASQSLALAAFTGFALATTVTEKEEAHDPHYDQIVYGTTDIDKIKQMRKEGVDQ